MAEGMTITQYALSSRLCGMRECIPMASLITKAELWRRSASREFAGGSWAGATPSSKKPAEMFNMTAPRLGFISPSICDAFHAYSWERLTREVQQHSHQFIVACRPIYDAASRLRIVHLR